MRVRFGNEAAILSSVNSQLSAPMRADVAIPPAAKANRGF